MLKTLVFEFVYFIAFYGIVKALLGHFSQKCLNVAHSSRHKRAPNLTKKLIITAQTILLIFYIFRLFF